MDYKNMTDSELAQVMINYISRVDHLRRIIANYLDGQDHGYIPSERIKEDYRVLKTELREDADYLNLVRNHKGSNLYMYVFSPSIKEAAAFGFDVPTNSRINQQMYSTVSEAYHKLTKHHTLDQWGALL